MAVTIQDAQLKLMITDGDVKPDVYINPAGHIVCHLTKGFVASTFPKDQGDALTAVAHAPVSVGHGDNIDAWSFGFVQIARANFYGAFYAGRISREGSVGVLAHNPPALASPILLDGSGDPPDPFFQDPSRTSYLPPMLHTSWGDHPAVRIPLTMPNPTTSGVKNHLFQFIFDREFWTIYTSKDPAGAIRYIVHFHWKVRYDVELLWRNQMPILRRSKSDFSMVSKNVKGAPTDSDLQAMLASPKGARANQTFDSAQTQAFRGARGPNRSENPQWFTTVPRDFWG
jgi:hypothetical protein